MAALCRTKMTKLTNQEKLALMLTNTASMRGLAAQIGATHQQVGRWLRNEAERGVPKRYQEGLEQAFKTHKKVVKAYSKANHIPFIDAAPVLLQRPVLNNGKPGERLVATHTQFLLPPYGSGSVMANYLASMRDTEQIQGVSARSEIDLYSYLDVPPEKGEEYLLERFRNAEKRDERGRKTLLTEYLEGEARKPGFGHIAPVYTQVTQFSPKAPIAYSLKELSDKLKQKHQSHAITFFDQLLIQTVPNQYEKTAPKQSAAKRRTSLKRK